MLLILLVLISLAAGSAWTPAGPTSLGFATGSANDLAVHPTNTSVVFVGTVNGGVWATWNAKAAKPLWKSLTASWAPSESIGALATDGTTLVAAIGHWSSYKAVGGHHEGIYLASLDRFGAVIGNWTVLPDPLLKGVNFRNLHVRGDTIVGSGAPFPTKGSFDTFPGTGQGVGGLVMSSNRGKTFKQIFSRSCSVSDLSVGGPAQALLWAFVSNCSDASAVSGLYLSTNGGATFALVSARPTFRFARIAAARDSKLFMMGFSEPVDREDPVIYTGVFDRSTASWTDVPVPELGPAYDERFAAVAVGASGSLYATTDGDGVVLQYQPSAGWNGVGEIIHADSRRLRVDSQDRLYATCDGGAYRFDGGAVEWVSFDGIQNTEAHSASFDPTTVGGIVGLQDNGVYSQQPSGGTRQWSRIAGGDGGKVSVWSNITYSVSYYSSQFFGGIQQTIFSSGSFVTSNSLNLASQLMYAPISVHAISSQRILAADIGVLYESFDFGNSFQNVTLPPTASPSVTGRMIYGAKTNPEFIAVATSQGLFVRRAAGRPLQRLGPVLRLSSVAYDESTDTLFVTAAQNNSYAFSVFQVASNGSLKPMGSPALSELYQFCSPLLFLNNLLLVGTRHGVWAARRSGGVFGAWTQFGAGLPAAALVADLEYFPRGPVRLLASTIGHSVWTMADV